MDLFRVLRVFAIVAFVFIIGYTVAAADDGTCASCHGDKARLASLSERGAKLYVDLIKAAEDYHARFDCTDCHGGDSTVDSTAACVGVAHPNPADPAIVGETCGKCHTDITQRHATSLHNTAAGIKNSLIRLLGEEQGTAKFEGGCNKCHATCSSCHMQDPDRRGIMRPRTESHNFEPKSKSENCAACHGAMGETYFGLQDDPEHGPSVMASAGIECIDCHSEMNMHGSGVEHRYVSEAAQPVCLSCHTQPGKPVLAGGAEVAPQFDRERPAHADHEGNLSCSACHTQWYQSCWNCHEGRESANVFELFLLRNQENGEIGPAVHPPVGTEWGGLDPDAGGWVMKARHSWGTSRQCEACHAAPATFIDEIGRQGVFVGAWGEPATDGQGARAAYIEPELVNRVVLNMDKFKQDVHGDLECADCHDTADNQACVDCHNETEKTGTTVLPPEGDWSRAAYMQARTALEETAALIGQAQAQDMDTTAWLQQSAALRDEYLAIGNAFHGEPGPAQAKMSDVAARSVLLRDDVAGALAAKQVGKERMATGLPLAAGLLGTLVIGMVLYLPNKKKQGDEGR